MNEAQEARFLRLEERLDEQGVRLQQKTERINNLEDVVAAQAMVLGGQAITLEEFIYESRTVQSRLVARVNLLKATDDYLLHMSDDVATYIHLEPGPATIAAKEGIKVALRTAREEDERE